MLQIPMKIKKKLFFVIKFDGLRGEKMKIAIVSASSSGGGDGETGNDGAKSSKPRFS